MSAFSPMFSSLHTDGDYPRRAVEILGYAVESLAHPIQEVGHALRYVIRLLEDMQMRRAFDPRRTSYDDVGFLSLQGEYGYRIPVWRALEEGLMAWPVIGDVTLAERVERFKLLAQQAATLSKLKAHVKEHVTLFGKSGFRLPTPDFDSFFAAVPGVSEMEQGMLEVAQLLLDLRNRVSAVWNEEKPKVVTDAAQIAEYLGWKALLAL
jgi:hypothetical protein